MKNILGRIIQHVWLVILITVASKLIGQFYPFSEFPMYSSFPDHASVYFITDANDRLMTTMETIGINASSFKQVLENRSEQIEGNASFDEKIAESARLSTRYLMASNDSAAKANQFGTLKVWQRMIYWEAGKVQTMDKELAQWP